MTNEGKGTTLKLARLVGPFILASSLGLAVWILIDPFLGGFWTLGMVIILLAKLMDNLRRPAGLSDSHHKDDKANANDFQF